MAALQNILRKALIIWLLLAVPAQVLAAVAPCEAVHHEHAQMSHQDHASHHQTFHHHSGDHAAPHVKCGTGCCCMGWMTPAVIDVAETLAGTEKIALITPHFSGFISETPQRPPNPLSA